MATKYKTTGCFKFLIFLVIAVPVAFFASSYYHGEDPVAVIKEKIGSASETTTSSRPSSTSDDSYKSELNELRNQVRRLKNENQNLKDVLEKKQTEIDALISNTSSRGGSNG